MPETRPHHNNREFAATRFPLIPADKGIPDVEFNADGNLNRPPATLEFDIETANGPVHAKLDFYYRKGWVEETFEHDITLLLFVQGEEVAHYNVVMETEYHPLVFDLRHRQVHKNFRGGKGLGTLAFQVMHEAVQNYVDKYLQGRCRSIIMNTWQPALTRLVIDQDWLKEQGLSDYKRSDGVNLGYRPSAQRYTNIVRQQLEATGRRGADSYAATSADYFVNPDTGENIIAELIRPLH